MVASGTLGLSSNLTSILCWTFLPSFLANTLLTVFYRLSPSARPSVPPRASPADLAGANAAAQAHHRRARILLVTAYLVYSVLSVYFSQSRGAEQNYYALLGLARDVVEREGAPAVKSHWRRLARVYHPDKVGKDGEAFFVLLRRGVEVLENDGRRWAYERFGPGVTDWGKLVTPREFLVKGAVNAAVWWAFAGGSIAVFSFFRKSERRNNFWRYLSLFLCVSLEFHLLLRSTPSPTFSLLFPARLPFEHTALLRQLFISASMAMSQLAPLLSPPRVGPSTTDDAVAAALHDAARLNPLLGRLGALIETAEREVAALQALELRPLLGPAVDGVESEGAAGEERVRREVGEKMVRVWEDLQIKGARGTAGVWTQAVRRGRGAAMSEKRREGKKRGAVKASVEEEKRELSAESADATVEKDREGEHLSTPPTLDAVSIPPPVTALASPPSSPQLGFPLSAVDLPVSSLVETEDEPAPVADGPVEEKESGALKPPPPNDAHRLPTPPPED
ncbi:hypothetical protein JCM3770_004675 [Rhodotorula araucariae]